jgi:hypothetical protein
VDPSARSGNFYMATNGTLQLATRGNFFMATDIGLAAKRQVPSHDLTALFEGT